MTVSVSRARATFSAQATDISFTGMHLRVETPPPLRELVRLELLLPQGERLQITAMAVHVSLPGRGRGDVAGVGLQLFGVDPRTKARWDQLVMLARAHFERTHHPWSLVGALPASTASRAMNSAPTPMLSEDVDFELGESVDLNLDEAFGADLALDPETIARQALALAKATPAPGLAAMLALGGLEPDDEPEAPRARPISPHAPASDPEAEAEVLLSNHVVEAYKPEFRLRLSGAEELATLQQQDFREVPMFIRTDVHLAPSARVSVRIDDPTLGGSLSIAGFVERRIDRLDFKGLAVRLLGLDRAGRIPGQEELTQDVVVTMDLDPGAPASFDAVTKRPASDRFGPMPFPTSPKAMPATSKPSSGGRRR
jgi:hypothetical protein